MRTTFLHNNKNNASQHRKRVRRVGSGPHPSPPMVVPLSGSSAEYVRMTATLSSCSIASSSSSSSSSRMTNTASTKPSAVRVLRSLSVPCNLPMAAESFMKVMEESMMRTEEKEEEPTHEAYRIDGSRCDDRSSDRDGFLPFPRADDSVRSEDEFFLPFDDDEVICETEELSLQKQTHPQPMADEKEGEIRPSTEPPRSGPEAAVAQLEVFFLGGSFLTARSHHGTAYSPVSTIEIDRVLCLERQQASKSSVLSSTTESVTNDSFPGNESLTSVLEEEAQKEEAGIVAVERNITACSRRRFTKMTREDRTMSLPLDFSSSTAAQSETGYPGETRGKPILPRRSSLKKISSYSQSPPSKPSSPSIHSLKRNVSFGSMKIREYNVALSDHPSCSYGPPIQLSWEYQEKEEVPLESYEASREGNRRSGHSLLLSFYERHFMLIQQAGYSKKEIKQTMKEVERVKRERRVTDLFLPASPLDETMERVMDSVKKYFVRPKANADTPPQREQAVV